LNWLVSVRHVELGRPGFPDANEPLAGQQRAGAGIGASHSERGARRPGATSKQEDHCGRAGSRSERGQERTSTQHGDPGAGLSCPSGQFAACSIHLLAGYDHSLLRCGLYEILEWTLAHLFNSGHSIGLPEAICP
jgi:hypothetical protein